MQRTLIPCPFCASQLAKLHYRSRCVKCEECGAEGPIGETAEQGARLWNNRPVIAERRAIPAPSSFIFS